MTREEKIELLEFVRQGLLINARVKSDYDIAEALGTAISALKGPTREQVEKMRGRFFQAGIDDVAQDTWRCSWCLVQEFGDIRGINFCPHCGSPMTDKAVETIMKRMEEMRND